VVSIAAATLSTGLPIAFQTEVLGVVRGMSGGRHAGFQMTAKVDREDWA
jgi:hypothetical protein